MRDHEPGATSGLPVWRRNRSATAPMFEENEFPMQCGGPDLTLAETEAYLKEQEQQRKREKEEAEAREREEAEERQAARHPSLGASDERNDEDEDRIAERYRNDRYSVKLLRQDESVWGGGGADSGMLG
ncbi:hypothetical protein ACPCHT_13280 [Nucisporomicrobium flavum]|uniref:hypothetical protein n=1 Tax=Nucisporomicrobium flavum TaxID=2785915 RepID=UPI0018F742E6|nr:hypothetical protein [Nucisporomicrobium flavum]